METTRRLRTLLLTAALAAVSLMPARAQTVTRTFVITRTLQLPHNADPVEVWVPLAPDTAAQQVLDVAVETDMTASVVRDRDHGNRVLFLSGHPGRVVVRERIKRMGVHSSAVSNAARALTTSERSALSQDLAPGRLVTLSPRIKALAAQITAGQSSMGGRVRAIYDYVRTTLHYDKSGTGWGNGDTEWACDAKRGNCTDFHSLFISLCRASGVPARFVIGYPVPRTANGKLSGYHCWAEVFIPGAGWLSVDASEASKDPRRADELFFGLDCDRFQLTTGRDLRLPGMKNAPLNYFVYAYAEADGKAVTVQTTAEFESISGPPPAASASRDGR